MSEGILVKPGEYLRSHNPEVEGSNPSPANDPYFWERRADRRTMTLFARKKRF